jgi:ABC-2 type transport system permease protein
MRNHHSSLGFTFSYLPVFLFNEIHLMGIMYWRYKWSSLVNTLMTAADFIWWILLIDGGTVMPHKIASLLLGYLIWAYANYLIYDAHYFIIEASQTGVLEQIYLSPHPFSPKLLGRFVAATVYCTLEISIIIAIIVLFLCPLPIPWNIAALVPFLVTLMGIAGLALILGGMGLVFKKSQPFAYLLTNLLLFFNGSVFPVESMPYVVQALSKTLPTTQGIIVLRNVTFGNQTLIEACTNGSLPLLIANSTVYLTLGWIIFKKCEKKAQTKGTLGHY